MDEVSESETHTNAPLDAEDRVQRAESALADALRERNRLWEDAHRARALERELEEVRAMVADMTSSVSWRVTAPLRILKTKAMRYRRLLEMARGKLRAG
jgi:hypothetical protein